MNDYIKREDAIKSVIEENLVGGIEAFEADRDTCCPTEWFDCLRDCVSTLEGLPSADVVEVVRCEDCKWWSKYMNYICGRMCEETKPKDYCSYGERHDNE